MLVHFRLSQTLRIIVGGAVVSLLVGCSTMRHGGAPEPSFNIKTDLEQLSQEFGPSTSITEFYRAPSKEERKKRRKMLFYDRIKILSLLLVVYGFLVVKLKADIPIMSWGEAVSKGSGRRGCQCHGHYRDSRSDADQPRYRSGNRRLYVAGAGAGEGT